MLLEPLNKDESFLKGIDFDNSHTNIGYGHPTDDIVMKSSYFRGKHIFLSTGAVPSALYFCVAVGLPMFRPLLGLTACPEWAQ